MHEVTVQCERNADGWTVAAPELDGFVTTSTRLDKVQDLIKALAAKKFGEQICDIVVKIDAVMPGIVCDIETAKAKMAEAARLQDEASTEIRDVVRRAREQGLTLRDIAVMLGVTPQRVAQLVD